MGRKTFESIGKVLPNRQTIVLSKNTNFSHPNIEVIADLEEVFNRYQNSTDEVFVFGGGEIFRLTLPFCTKIYATMILHSFSGDCTFPEIPMEEWEIVHSIPGVKDQNNPYSYNFVTFERRKEFV